MTGEHPLVMRGISVRYGAVEAVRDISGHVGRGEVVGLIGPNGAGKTSLIDALSGFCRASGEVELCGRNVSNLSAHERARLGLGRTFQGAELFRDLTVEENLLVGVERAPWWSPVRDMLGRRRRDHDEAVARALGAVGVGRQQAAAYPGELSQGARKLVAVARALAASPEVILLDEPAAGLDSHESVEFGERLKRVRDDGVGILLVDHDVELIFGVCERIYVMNFGSLIASGPAAAVRADPGVIDAYLGVVTSG